ncbi:nucleoid DNA-binding protein [Sphingobium sp. B1D3A]|uniref:Nucleoid DNA-binding protein n=2 Tax=Sphingomonadaceae TaxID=41297 RepID=A0ABR6NDK6_9SPHN|nr:nucleoid DNA-binding protein [Sphingobium lignivorans]
MFPPEVAARGKSDQNGRIIGNSAENSLTHAANRAFMRAFVARFPHKHIHEGGSLGMNKQDLISSVADQGGLTKADAGKAVEAVFDAITAALKKGDEVRLVGFGTFSVSKRKASTGRNPRTGETMAIKASSQPKFKAGKGLKDAVN